MRLRFIALCLAMLAALSCRGRTVPVDTTDAKDLPRDFAIGRLKELLPTTAVFVSFAPLAKCGPPRSRSGSSMTPACKSSRSAAIPSF